MTLEEHIDDIRKGLKDGTFKDENDVCEFIVKRLLQALDWNIYDRGVVIREYPVKSGENSGRADFALFHPPSAPSIFPKILIEVKRVGRIDASAEEQLFRYAYHKGVPVLILTDGKGWHFFYGTGEGSYDERRVCVINLEEMDSGKNAELLRRYLKYRSVCAGEAREAIIADHHTVVRQQRITNALPEAWTALIEEADELLRDVVADKVRELCGDEPSHDQVLDFLSNLESRQTPERLIAQTQRTPSSGSGSASSGSGQKPLLRFTRLDVTINGETIAKPNGTDTFVEVIKRLGIDRLYNLGVDWVTISEPSRKHRKIGRYYITTHGDTKTLKRRLEKAASGLEVQLTVKTVPK